MMLEPLTAPAFRHPSLPVVYQLVERLASQWRVCVSPFRFNAIWPAMVSFLSVPEYLFVLELPLNCLTRSNEMASPSTLPLEIGVSTVCPSRPGTETLPVSLESETLKVSVLTRSGPPFRPGVFQVQFPVRSAAN